MPDINDDPDAIPEGQLLALPGEAIPAGRLTAFFTRKAALLRQQDLDELAFERSGNSTRHFMLFPDQDPKIRQQREDEERRRAWLAEQEMLEYAERSNRLLAEIDYQQRAIEKRRKEIEDNAIRLRDGHRVYVDGDQYRDESGAVLKGRDRDEAAGQHLLNPDASTWEQKQDIDRQAEEMKRLREKVLNDQNGGGTTAEKQERLQGYEQEFAEKVTARQQAMGTTATGSGTAVPDYGSADYMTELGGGEYALSTVPAFTDAAQANGEPQIVGRKDADTENPQTQNAPKAGALKL